MTRLPLMRSLCLLFLLVALPAQGAALPPADTLRSPVFKPPRPPLPGPLYQESDITWELWSSFVTVREANAGDPVAQHRLGLRYLLGRGFTPDTMLAAMWVGRAAGQNLLPARFNMGIFLLNGWGVQWDPFEASRLFEEAAERGMPEAHYALGIMFVENLVYPRDLKAAERHFRVAADSGFAAAREMAERLGRFAEEEAARKARRQDSTSTNVLGMMVIAEEEQDAPPDTALLRAMIRAAGPETRRALGMAGRGNDAEGVREDTLRASLLRAANAGSPEALTVLGRWHETGQGGKKDPLAAAAYYARAMRLGSPQAAVRLSAMLERGEVATELRRRSAEPEAKFAWATLLALGFSGPLYRQQAYLTEGQAVVLQQESAASDYIPAMVELGIWRFSGRWVPMDRDEAKLLWERASRLGSSEAAVRLAMTAITGGAEGGELADALATLSAAAEEGAVLAEVALAYCFEEGRGVPRNLPAAVRFYRNAAQRGSEDAFRALRRLHDGRRPAEGKYALSDG